MALTVGVGTIMDAREVALIATGPGKARAVKMGIEGGINHLWTVSALQRHPQCLMVVDKAACQELMMKTVKVRSFEMIAAFKPADSPYTTSISNKSKKLP